VCSALGVEQAGEVWVCAFVCFLAPPGFVAIHLVKENHDTSESVALWQRFVKASSDENGRPYRSIQALDNSVAA
jgi:hypothetical protein